MVGLGAYLHLAACLLTTWYNNLSNWSCLSESCMTKDCHVWFGGQHRLTPSIYFQHAWFMRTWWQTQKGLVLLPSWCRFICPPRAWDLSNASSQNLQRNSLCSLAPASFFVSVCNKRNQKKSVVSACIMIMSSCCEKNIKQIHGRVFTVCMILHVFAKQVLFFEYCSTILAYLFLEGKWWIKACKTIITTFVNRRLFHDLQTTVGYYQLRQKIINYKSA